MTTIIDTTLTQGIVLGSASYAATVTITHHGNIAGAAYAIFAPPGLGGVSIGNAGTVSATTLAVVLNDGGTLTNAGSIHATTAAVALALAADMSNTGDISAGSYGIGLFGNSRLTNAGSISASGVGVAVTSGTVTNSGSIYGAVTGITLQAGLITNAADISGSAIGAALFAGSLVNQQTGHISGISAGIYITGSTASLTNAGTITASGSALLEAQAHASNAGLLQGSTIGLFLQSGYLANSGIITAGNFGAFMNGGTLQNTGSIFGGLTGIALNGGTIRNTGTIAGGLFGIDVFGGALTNGGTITGAAYAIYSHTQLALTLTNGAAFAGKVQDKSNDGALILSGSQGGTLTGLGTSLIGFTSIDFAAASPWTLEAATTAVTTGQTITGFTIGDTIILDHLTANPLATTYVTGQGLELTDTSGDIVTLNLTGDFTSVSFQLTEAAGNTNIALALCYLRGTRIATPAGDRPIESLVIGDAVITKFNGYRRIKWIGRQSYAARLIADDANQIPVKFAAGSLGPNTPSRDLFVSPGHSMLIAGRLILAKSLVNGITITQTHCPDQLDYFQIEFETHDCLLAEGAWSESYADSPALRATFHNAKEFYTLYPDHLEPPSQQLCAPRPLTGPGLEAALRPLLAKLPLTPGKLHGCIDEMSPSGIIRGWAWDEANPHRPVALEILNQHRLLGAILACDHRPDLAKAGLARGHCSFTFTTPHHLPRNAALTIRRANDHAEIHPAHGDNPTQSTAARPGQDFGNKASTNRVGARLSRAPSIAATLAASHSRAG
jgi:hypothetical protein